MVKAGTAEFDFIANDKVSRVLGKIEKNTKKSSKNITQENQKVKKSFLDIGQVVNTAFGFSFAQIIGQATAVFQQFASQGVKNALAFEQELISLNIQTKNTADTLINDLSVATQGLVSQLDLAAGANRALALGLSRETLPALAETSVALGKLTGRSATEAFDDIVTGIGRASPLILDNLGIVIDSKQVYDEYAESIGKTRSELSKMEETYALTNSVIESSRAVTLAMQVQQETLNDTFSKFSAQLQDVIREDIEGLIDILLAGNKAVTGLVGQTELMNETLGDLPSQAQDYADFIFALTEDSREASTEIKALRNELENLATGSVPLTKDERDIQDQIEREKLKQLRLKAERDQTLPEGFAPEDVQIERSEDRVEQLRQEADLIRQEKVVAQQEFRDELEKSGQIEANYIADNLESLREKFKEQKTALEDEIDRRADIELALDNVQTKLQNNLEKQQEINSAIREEIRLRREAISVGTGYTPPSIFRANDSALEDQGGSSR